MLPAALEQQLSEIEQQGEALASALGDNDAVALEALGLRLRQAAIQLAHSTEVAALDGLPKREFKSRLAALAQQLGAQRSGLARRAAVVERALHAMVPATRESTYGQHASPYGAPGRQSGAFKTLAA